MMLLITLQWPSKASSLLRNSAGLTMFLGRLMAGGRREEGPDLRAASHEHLQLVDEVTATLSKLQESARNQFIKVNVGGYRWYHDDTYSFPPSETGQFRNSRGVPRIENWRLSDLVTLKEALDQECISVECKRKRRIDENEPAIESTEKEKGRPKHALSSSAPSEDGMAKLLHERDSLQKMLANANKDISALRLSLANSEAERETVKHQLWMMEAQTPKDERTSPAGPVKTDAATQESHFSEMDAAYEKWKTAGALEYGFLSRILKNDYELLVAAGRFFEGAEDTSARQGYDSPQNGRSSMQGQYSESEAEFSRSDKPFFSRAKSSKKSDVEKEISAADVTFIITCLQNTSGGSLSIDIPAVAKALLYTNPKSVTNKIAFMRKKYDIPITGARPKPEESFPPRRTSLLPSKGTPGPKPKSRPSNGYLQTPTIPSDNVGTYHQWQPETEIVVAPPATTPIPSTENPVSEWRPPVVDDQKPQSRTPLPSMVPDDGTSIRVQARTPLPSAIRATEQSIQVIPGPRAHEEDLIQPKVESRAASPSVKRGFVAVNGNYGDNPNKKPHVEPTNGHGERLT